MAKGKELSEIEKIRIKALHEAGLSYSEIAKKVQRSKYSIQHVISPKSQYYKKCRTGRPPKLNSRAARRVINHFSNIMSSQAPGELGFNVSHETVRKALHRNGQIVHKKKKHAPALKLQHKTARVNFCRTNI